MDERLIKQWRVTEALLRTSAAEIANCTEFVECNNFLDHNEFELAFHVLEDAGRAHKVSLDYWSNLKKAADAMGLREH